MASQEKKEIRVLVVDDSSPNRKNYERMLDHFGIEHDITADVPEALEKFQETEYSHVFCDGLRGEWQSLAKHLQEPIQRDEIQFRLVTNALLTKPLARRLEELGGQYTDRGEIVSVIRSLAAED